MEVQVDLGDALKPFQVRLIWDGEVRDKQLPTAELWIAGKRYGGRGVGRLLAPGRGALPQSILEGPTWQLRWRVPGHEEAQLSVRPGIQSVTLVPAEEPDDGVNTADITVQVPELARVPTDAVVTLRLSETPLDPAGPMDGLGFHLSPSHNRVHTAEHQGGGRIKWNGMKWSPPNKQLAISQTHWLIRLEAPPPLSNPSVQQRIDGGTIHWPSWPPPDLVPLQLPPGALEQAL